MSGLFSVLSFLSFFPHYLLKCIHKQFIYYFEYNQFSKSVWTNLDGGGGIVQKIGMGVKEGKNETERQIKIPMFYKLILSKINAKM